MNKKIINPSIRYSLISVPLLISSFSIQAAIISLDLETTSTVDIDGTLSSGTPTVTTSPDGIESSVLAYDLHTGAANMISAGRAEASGDMDGVFKAEASGYGIYRSEANFAQHYTITNDTSVSEILEFSFDIKAGTLSTTCESRDLFGDDTSIGFISCGGSDYSLAGYDARITLTDASGVSNILWESGAELRSTYSFETLTKTGTDLNGIFERDQAVTEGEAVFLTEYDLYSWGPQSFLLDLGEIGAGETFYLDYEVMSYVEGNENNCTPRNSDGSISAINIYNEDGSYSHTEDNQDWLCSSDGYGEFPNNARAYFQDPTGFNSQGGFAANFTSSPAAPPTSVPEPEMLALFSTGLIGLLVTSRRKKLNTKI